MKAKSKSKVKTIRDGTEYSMNPEKTVNKTSREAIEDAIRGGADYSQNPGKTKGGELVKSYECDPRTVTEEFLLAKKEYEFLTGRDQGKRDILFYRVRQSFKPGEIEPEKALEVGYDLGMRWTKGRHAFIVSVHTDRAHIHCHIDYNSTTLDCRGKYDNFKNSSFALQRLSDIICLEHGLSIIEKPQPSKGKTYDKWLGGKEATWQDKLRRKIDEVLPACQTFGDFLAALKAAGYIVNSKRKHISAIAPGQKKPTRLNTLGGDHTEEAIRERLGMARTGAGGAHARTVPVGRQVSLLIDIQAKIREGKGAGYEHWARIFNLKEAAKTLVFLKENGIDSYEDLVKKASSASGDFSSLTKKIKDAETRMAGIAELQKHIGTYGKTRDVYAQYRKSGWSEKFYEEHRTDITLHRAAKKHFDDAGYGKNKKLPTIAALRQEYAALLAEKKKCYSGYREKKSDMQALLIAKGNADKILGVRPDAQNRDASRGKTRSDTLTV